MKGKELLRVLEQHSDDAWHRGIGASKIRVETEVTDKERLRVVRKEGASEEEVKEERLYSRG